MAEQYICQESLSRLAQIVLSWTNGQRQWFRMVQLNHTLTSSLHWCTLTLFFCYWGDSDLLDWNKIYQLDLKVRERFWQLFSHPYILHLSLPVSVQTSCCVVLGELTLPIKSCFLQADVAWLRAEQYACMKEPFLCAVKTGLLPCLSSLPLGQVNVICSGSGGDTICTNTGQLRGQHTFPSVVLHADPLVVWLAFLFLQVKIIFLSGVSKEADL